LTRTWQKKYKKKMSLKDFIFSTDKEY
jgi:hypothetical protein